MFSYFGSKAGIINLYPTAARGLPIIEPFAGSARYCARFWKRDCWVNDKYDVVYRIWKYIRKATPEQISSLPLMATGESTTEGKTAKRGTKTTAKHIVPPFFDDCGPESNLIFKKIKGDGLRSYSELSEVEQLLLGFAVGIGRAEPSHVVTGFGATSSNGKDAAFGRGEIVKLKKRLMSICGKITHWKVTNKSYDELPDIEAVWYIDPPYRKEGFRYHENKIDYDHLGKWCMSRKGQVIVCEGKEHGDWLPFRPLRLGFKGAAGVDAPEYVWYNEHPGNKFHGSY